MVAPGFIETDMTAELPEAQQAEYKKSIPAGRFATPDEVAKVIVWLAGDDAAYISGRSSRSTAASGWATEPYRPAARHRTMRNDVIGVLTSA